MGSVLIPEFLESPFLGFAAAVLDFQLNQKIDHLDFIDTDGIGLTVNRHGLVIANQMNVNQSIVLAVLPLSADFLQKFVFSGAPKGN